MSTGYEAGPERVDSAQQPAASRALWRLNFRSLRVQMALGSAAVVLAAVVLVAAIALVTVVVSFNAYQSAQLTSETNRIAAAIGQGSGLTSADRPQNPASLLDSYALRDVGSLNIWLMDASGRVLIGGRVQARDARSFAADADEISSALAHALQGQSSSGSLPGQSKLGLTQRIYAAAPIRIGGTPDGAIIGAVALSTPLRQDAAALYAMGVSRIILVLALMVAGIAALVAALFSRRVTGPLEHVAAAASRMASGDYGTRVSITAPDELRTLATSFNDMACALQRDISELRRQEQLRRELIANVSHELATPLTAIQGFTEALQDEVIHDPAERAETTRLIAREAARLRRLVDQLRQVALFEGGAQALNRTAVQVPSLVTETLAVLAPEMERKQVTVVNELPGDLPAVYADDDRLTEILLNLFDNALRHTPAGGRIEVRGRVEGRLAQVTIADTGPGIAPADRQKVFERFYRVDPSRNSATGGSGLGLAIVRALVEAHGGTIAVADRAGGGAQFTFTLPTYQ
ncbi:MAG TPA: ATP-binding protein [Ktedonobacterales bacterium]